MLIDLMVIKLANTISCETQRRKYPIYKVIIKLRNFFVSKKYEKIVQINRFCAPRKNKRLVVILILWCLCLLVDLAFLESV